MWVGRYLANEWLEVYELSSDLWRPFPPGGKWPAMLKLGLVSLVRLRFAGLASICTTNNDASRYRQKPPLSWYRSTVAFAACHQR